MSEDELILTSIRKCERSDLYANHRPLSLREAMEYADMKRRRRRGEPLQYIIGECAFYNIKLMVNEDVLIPRPETEFLVEYAIKKIKTLDYHSVKILDIGVGSGNISLSLAKNIANAFIVGIDISKKALDCAHANATLNQLEEKVHFIKSDMFYHFDRIGGPLSFDVIISNPPYIKTKDLADLPYDVQKEPPVALNGGLDGLLFYRKIAKEAHRFLNPGGFLFLEIGDGTKDDIIDIFMKKEHWVVKETRRDYNQKDRILFLQRR